MLTSEQKLIQKALEYIPSTDVFGFNICQNNGDTIKKNIFIDDEYFPNSTLEIWQTKEVSFADIKQYDKYNNFVMEFQLNFACFMNPNIDLYYYKFKRCI